GRGTRRIIARWSSGEKPGSALGARRWALSAPERRYFRAASVSERAPRHRSLTGQRPPLANARGSDGSASGAFTQTPWRRTSSVTFRALRRSLKGARPLSRPWNLVRRPLLNSAGDGLQRPCVGQRAEQADQQCHPQKGEGGQGKGRGQAGGD